MSMFLKKTATQLLKEEFREARDELTQQNLISLEGFQKIAAAKYPEYDTPEGYTRIRNAWYGNGTDLYLTRIINEVKINLIPPVE